MLHLSDILKTTGPRSSQLRLGRYGRVLCEPGWELGEQWSTDLQDYDLWVIWHGCGCLVREKTRVELRTGTCLWLSPGNRYHFTQDPKNRLGVTYIHFSVGKKTRTEAPPFEALETRHFEFINAATQRIVESDTAGGTTFERDLLALVLQQLIEEHASLGAARPNGTTRRHFEIVHQVAREIREQPGAVKSVTELAQAAGYSVDHFSRIFRQVTGKTPQQYAIDARMDRARLLLAESQFSVGEVAAALGYESPHFFSRQFFQQNGAPPTAFRRRQSTPK